MADHMKKRCMEIPRQTIIIRTEDDRIVGRVSFGAVAGAPDER
jgi:hypothetical protein